MISSSALQFSAILLRPVKAFIQLQSDLLSFFAKFPVVITEVISQYAFSQPFPDKETCEALINFNPIESSLLQEFLNSGNDSGNNNDDESKVDFSESEVNEVGHQDESKETGLTSQIAHGVDVLDNDGEARIEYEDSGSDDANVNNLFNYGSVMDDVDPPYHGFDDDSSHDNNDAQNVDTKPDSNDEIDRNIFEVRFTERQGPYKKQVYSSIFSCYLPHIDLDDAKYQLHQKKLTLRSVEKYERKIFHLFKIPVAIELDAEKKSIQFHNGLCDVPMNWEMDSTQQKSDSERAYDCLLITLKVGFHVAGIHSSFLPKNFPIQLLDITNPTSPEQNEKEIRYIAYLIEKIDKHDASLRACKKLKSELKQIRQALFAQRRFAPITFSSSLKTEEHTRQRIK